MERQRGDSEHAGEFLAAQLAITQDLAEESGPYRLSGMRRNDRDASIRMFQEGMASASANDLEAKSCQSRD